MYTKDQLDDIYKSFVNAIDISEELFDEAEAEYIQLGEWIDKETPAYKLSIYPQGSFALGTVIKPISDTDDYDLDLVCEFEKQYGLSSKQLKCVLKPLLTKYRRVSKIVEKRRCWHVEYTNLPRFHMDVVPGVNRERYIDITDHNEVNGSYEFIGSNPKGYIAWFNSRKEGRRKAILEKYKAESKVIKSQADIEQIKEYKLKTPLQKTIQLLKRHRDIMFENCSDQLKPVSIIITTLAGQLYNNEETTFDTLSVVLNNAEGYLLDHKVNGVYHVDNPSYTGRETENFADKWNEHPERADAFMGWVRKAKSDLISEQLYKLDRIGMAENMKRVFGRITGDRVYNEMAEEERRAIIDQRAKIMTQTGAISARGTIKIPANRHFHGD